VDDEQQPVDEPAQPEEPSVELAVHALRHGDVQMVEAEDDITPGAAKY
jgi:hypothetical protein